MLDIFFFIKQLICTEFILSVEQLRQRQQTAAELRKRVDLANAMKDPELHELRTDIKVCALTPFDCLC